MFRIANVFSLSALRVVFHHSNVSKSLPSVLYRAGGTASEVNHQKLAWRLPKYAQNKQTEET
jgi:hypothetical protein